MRDILDPADIWLGTPRGALVFGNKRPVAQPDAVTVQTGTGPVSVAVLINDFDPEGGALTLISASAALGTAVAETNGTVTYTPPPGVTGFDTVVYEIADDQNQRRTGQIDVTIVDPQLSIEATPGNTLVVNATGTVDITVTDPPAFAGTYQIDTASLSGGPIPLVPPSVGGTASEGQVLTAAGGLWINDTAAGTPTRGWQWRRGTSDIPGAVTSSYTVAAADVGQTLSVAETLTDTFGQRSAMAAAGTGQSGAGFSPASDPALFGWWDADDAATITAPGGVVSAWADKAGGAPLEVLTSAFSPASGTRMLNGRNVIDFTNDSYLEASRALPVSGDVALHMVVEIDAVANAFEALLAFDATNDMQIDAAAAAQFDGRLNAAGIGASMTFSGGPYSGPIILSAIFDQSGTGQARVFVSGVSRGATSYTQPLDSAILLYLMTNRSRNAWMQGAVAELLLTGDLTNRANYHAYLANKWGLS